MLAIANTVQHYKTELKLSLPACYQEIQTRSVCLHKKTCKTTTMVLGSKLIDADFSLINVVTRHLKKDFNGHVSVLTDKSTWLRTDAKEIQWKICDMMTTLMYNQKQQTHLSDFKELVATRADDRVASGLMFNTAPKHPTAERHLIAAFTCILRPCTRRNKYAVVWICNSKRNTFRPTTAQNQTTSQCLYYVNASWECLINSCKLHAKVLLCICQILIK